MVVRRLDGRHDDGTGGHGTGHGTKETRLITAEKDEVAGPVRGGDSHERKTIDESHVGSGKSGARSSPVIGWADFWTELSRCGRAGWPQLIRLPEWMLKSGASYEREQLASLFKHSMTNPSAGRKDREVRFETLEPDGDGNYFAVRADADEGAGTAADGTGEGAEDHRTVVFLDASEVVP